MAIVFHVVVDADGHRVGIVSADDDLPAFRPEAEDISLARCLAEREHLLIAWEQAMHQSFHS